MACVFLIGMPGSGKSTLARHFNGRDMDDIIRLRDLVRARLSPDAFYDAESERILEYLEKHPTVGVYATGGSVVHRSATMKAIRKKARGAVVWLYAPLDALRGRLGNLQDRGVMFPDGIDTLDALHAYREPLYRKFSDYTIDTVNKSVEECRREVEIILRSL